MSNHGDIERGVDSEDCEPTPRDLARHWRARYKIALRKVVQADKAMHSNAGLEDIYGELMKVRDTLRAKVTALEEELAQVFTKAHF